jgi:hypothetical protein
VRAVVPDSMQEPQGTLLFAAICRVFRFGG